MVLSDMHLSVDAPVNGGNDHARRYQQQHENMLLAVLNQSRDCIKIISPDGKLEFMNLNGQCAMEIDDFTMVAGADWAALWPEPSQHLIRDAVQQAAKGDQVRFEAYCPTAKGTERWWDVSVSPVYDANGQLKSFVSVSRDVTDRVRQRETLSAVSAEMRHRLRNAYTLTTALTRSIARGDENREAFASELTQRFEQLGRAQSLVVDAGQDDDTEIPLPAFIRDLTSVFETGVSSLSVRNIPDIVINARHAQALALVFGELSTNSCKHGAFGKGGRVAITGHADAHYVTLMWDEQGEQPISATSRDGGQGMALIERVIKAQGGDIIMRWGTHGPMAQLRLPRAE